MQFKIGDFEGPLDLLIYLIEKNEIDLFDIPIASLTDQYMEHLTGLEDLDIDVASDFLVMGASLMELKSRMMLPREKVEDSGDPRDELVLRLLAYRRCKYIAKDLELREKTYQGVAFRLPARPQELGLNPLPADYYYADESEFSLERFNRAVESLSTRNGARFQDITEKMNYIVSRDQWNLKKWIQDLWRLLKRKTKLKFNEVFPFDLGPKKRLTGFLALLELVKQNQVTAKQDGPFQDIEIKPLEVKPGE